MCIDSITRPHCICYGLNMDNLIKALRFIALNTKVNPLKALLENSTERISTVVVLMICVTRNDLAKMTESAFPHRVVTSANVRLVGRAKTVLSGLTHAMVSSPMI